MSSQLKALSSRFIASRYSLMAYIIGLVRDGHVADDVFQEVWIRLAEALEKGTEIRDVESWCRGVARNLALHHWRDERLRRVVVDSRLLERMELAFAESSQQESHLEAYRLALRECMKDLPEQSKSLLRLTYDQGLPARDVGRQVRKTADGVRMALVRIRRALEHCSERRLRSEGVI